MVTGIVIPHDNTKALQRAEFESLADYQTAVGGYIEIVRVHDHPLVIVANEEGKLRRLPVNRRATCLWWLLNPAGLGGDVLVGDVIILGSDQDGEMGSTPDKLFSLLFETKRYQVQVVLSPEFDSWVEIGEPVNEFFEATARALRLIEVWDPPSAVRVVAVE